MFSSQKVGLSKVDDLVTGIERVHVDAEVSKERINIALETLHTLVAPDFVGDAVTVYSDMLRAIERSDAQLRELRSSVTAMKVSAGPVFAQWTEDLDQFNGEAMRRRSQSRLEETRQRYKDIVNSVEPALEGYTRFNAAMRDHALFLGHDFNPTAISEIEGDIRTLTNLSSDINEDLDNCLEAARVYVELAALPLHLQNDSSPSLRETPSPRQTEPKPTPRLQPRNLEEQRRQRQTGSKKL
ncbi:MAG: DUF2959 family protein [Planctomycetota bacterium]|jgi:hypothetical protein